MMSLYSMNAPIGEQIKSVRKALGMTQEQLAVRSGTRQSVIAGIESGKRNDLRHSTIMKIAAGLNCAPFLFLNPQESIEKILDERSTKLAQEIISATSGSTAIEMQLPDPSVIDREFRKVKNDILKNHKSALWDGV